MVRFDSSILLLGKKEYQSPPASALSTIKYLHNAGAKVILVGSWSWDINLRLSSAESAAGDYSCFWFIDEAAFHSSFFGIKS